ASRQSLFHPCAPPFFSGWQPATDESLCCELSRLAYCGRPVVEAELPAASMRFVAGFADGGTYAFLAEGVSPRPPRAVLAFRGTEPDDPTDIIDDARFLPAGWSGNGLVHIGFFEALDRVWKDVAKALTGLGKPVLFTGHSLGAALATLAAGLRAPSQLIT